MNRFRDEPGGCPFIGQVVSGVEAARARSAASAWNVGRRVSILMLPFSLRGDERREEERWRQKPLTVEYRCGIRWRTGS